jgi:hypothetical protein
MIGMDEKHLSAEREQGRARVRKPRVNVRESSEFF